MNTPPPAEGAVELGERGRAIGVIFWSAFPRRGAGDHAVFRIHRSGGIADG